MMAFGWKCSVNHPTCNTQSGSTLHRILLCDKPLKRAAEEVAHVAFDFGTRGFPAGGGEVFVFVGEHLREDRARVLPLVDELVEHAAVAVLRSHTQADQFEAHPRNLLDDRWVIEEPPAAEDVQVAKFARGDAKLVLVLPCEHGAEEFVVGE